MEVIMGALLGTLGLFFPFLIASIITFVYAIIMRSWIWMLVSALLLYPDAWFISAHPPFPWVLFVPLIQVVLAIIFYLTNRNKRKT